MGLAGRIILALILYSQMFDLELLLIKWMERSTERFVRLPKLVMEVLLSVNTFVGKR